MSRSYKKNPIGGICSSLGQKKFKQYEHKAERRIVKNYLIAGKEMPHPKEYGNEWISPRDGKCYNSKDIIKDFPKILRK